jgi:hypothetical protein
MCTTVNVRGKSQCRISGAVGVDKRGCTCSEARENV